MESLKSLRATSLFSFQERLCGGARKSAGHVPVWSSPYIPARGVTQTVDADRCREPQEKASEVRTTGGRIWEGQDSEGSPGGVNFSRRQDNRFASRVLPGICVTSNTVWSV
jgi:hypothetical protein